MTTDTNRWWLVRAESSQCDNNMASGCIYKSGTSSCPLVIDWTTGITDSGCNQTTNLDLSLSDIRDLDITIVSGLSCQAVPTVIMSSVPPLFIAHKPLSFSSSPVSPSPSCLFLGWALPKVSQCFCLICPQTHLINDKFENGYFFCHQTLQQWLDSNYICVFVSSAHNIFYLI